MMRGQAVLLNVYMAVEINEQALHFRSYNIYNSRLGKKEKDLLLEMRCGGSFYVDELAWLLRNRGRL